MKTQKDSASRPDRRNGPWLWIALFAAIASGCDAQDMVVQPKVLTYQPSDFFPDGQSSRPVVAGTIARGQLNVNPAHDVGMVDGKLVDELPEPLKLSRELLRRGQERFNIYCAPCHDRSGQGEGMIVKRGFSPPPSLHEDRLREAPIGYFFHVMTKGYGAMYSYASRIEPDDRWAIAAYIRDLQLSQNAKLADVPAERQADLEKNAR